MEMIQPDIMLVDMLLNESSIKFIDQLAEHRLSRKPVIVISLDDRAPKLEKFFLRSGVMYIFDNNMREEDLVESILYLYTTHRSFEREDELLLALSRMLRACYISPQHRGYACIFDSVCLILHHDCYAQSLTKKVYPQIAVKHQATAIRVEKNMRDAIKTAWANGGRDVMPAYLGCGHTKPPTNGQFISAVCEKLKETLLQKEKTAPEQYIL